tara:strand:+ start:202 stop:1038 length:837 start_codon:yes stop_codon:yes gene_type:complete
VKIAKSISAFSNIRNTFKGSIGFVPTMGALHDGHLSLVKKSNNQCNYTIVSIFVNPKQFAPNEDFKHYPRTLEDDIKKLNLLNVDLLFIPTANEIYHEQYTDINYDSAMFSVLEGITRPHFFKGVCNVVARLFDIIKPTDAFFGEKDFQQLRIIEDMTQNQNYNINIRPCKIIREENGLAMSSRNEYLNENNRNNAKIIFETLKLGIKLINDGEKKISNIYDVLIKKLSSTPNLSIDYIKIIDYKSLIEFSDIIDNNFIICVAVYMGNTRLIDNIYNE